MIWCSQQLRRIMQPTARQFGNAVRKCLSEHPYDSQPKVKTKTWGFGGLGYGESIDAEIITSSLVPDSTQAALSKVRSEFEDQASESNHFLISLAGSPYPFGGKC